MDYAIITHNDLERMDQVVNKWIKDGWTPQGGIAIALDQGEIMYVQAMVKVLKK